MRTSYPVIGGPLHGGLYAGEEGERYFIAVDKEAKPGDTGPWVFDWSSRFAKLNPRRLHRYALQEVDASRIDPDVNGVRMAWVYKP